MRVVSHIHNQSRSQVTAKVVERKFRILCCDFWQAILQIKCSRSTFNDSASLVNVAVDPVRLLFVR